MASQLPSIPQVAWAFAKLDCPAPRVLRHAGSQLAARTSAFNDKEASNVLWALASQVRRSRWLEISREVFDTGRQWRARRRERASSIRLTPLARHLPCSDGCTPGVQEVAVPAAELDAIAANLQPRLRTFGPQARLVPWGAAC